MRSPITPSIDQLLVLLAVVETGSFTAAAKRLGRATSAISYAIDTIEEQLGLPLFDRGTTRKPVLTTQGEAVVAEARAVAQSVDMLRARVKGLLNDLEPEISIVVDTLFPHERLIPILCDFYAAFPTVPVRLQQETLGGVERAIRSGDNAIGISGWYHTNTMGMRRLDIDGIELIPVAAPHHPLAAPAGKDQRRPQDFVQIVLSERPHGEKRDFGVVGLNNWRIGDIATKRRLLLAGVGWGGMPEEIVRADLAARKLVHLDLPDWRGGIYPLMVTHMADTPPGPAGRWLISRLGTRTA